MYKETYNKAMKVIKHSSKGYPDEPCFGKEIDHKFESILANVYQTFDKHDLFSTKEDKATRLNELIIDGHPFISGNHRIASLLRKWMLKNN